MAVRNGVLRVKLNAGAMADLRIVDLYTHMGSAACAGGEMGPEFRRRPAASRTGSIVRADITQDMRLGAATAKCFSRLLYNAGTWPPVPLSCYYPIRTP